MGSKEVDRGGIFRVGWGSSRALLVHRLSGANNLLVGGGVTLVVMSAWWESVNFSLWQSTVAHEEVSAK